jgi:MFS family permease
VTPSHSPQAPIRGAAARTSWLQLGVVAAGSFVTWTGFGAIIPYLPVFLKTQAHSSLLMIGVVTSMFYVGTLVFSSPLGWLSDLVGRKPIMIFGAAVYTLALLLFTTTTDPHWFVLFRLLEGIGTAAFGPAAQSFVADITSENNRSKAYGFLTTAQYGGLVFGPAMAAPLYHVAGGGLNGFYAIFFFGAALSGLSLLSVIVFVHEPAAYRSRRAQRRAEQVERRGGSEGRVGRPPYGVILSPAIVALLIIAFTNNYAMGSFEVIWSLWLQRLGASLTFISFTWVAFSVPMLLSFVGGIAADRYSRFWLFVTGYTLSGFAWVYYGLSHNLTLFITVNALEGLAIAFSYPAKQALLVQVSPRRWIGTITGVESSATQLAGLLGSLTAPLLYGVFSGRVLLIAGVFGLVGMAVAAPILHRDWTRLKAAGNMPRQAELERLADEVRQPSAAEPPLGME